jgi:hypothetical protein
VLSPSDISAVIVTKGDVDLTPVLDSLIFDDVRIWDNSVQHDLMTHGRVVAAMLARHPIVYSQDDDIIHTAEAQERIVDSYDEGILTGCMWPEWSVGAKEQGIPYGYDDLVFPGSGSISDVWLWEQCVDEYLAHWPEDDFFLLWSDTIIGIIAPTKQLDIRFEILPCAEDETRMANLPDAVALKTEAIRRAREVRDMVRA